MYKIYEMLEGCVKMSLFLKGDDILKVGMVDVSIDTKQTFENCLGDCNKVPWKGNTCEWPYHKNNNLHCKLTHVHSNVITIVGQTMYNSNNAELQ